MESDILISTFHQWTLTELNPAASSVVALMAPLVHQPLIFCSFYLAWLVVSLNLLQHLMQNTHVPKNACLLHVTSMLTHYFDYVYYRLQVMVLIRPQEISKKVDRRNPWSSDSIPMRLAEIHLWHVNLARCQLWIAHHLDSWSWLVVYLPLWKIWVRQLGWWHSQYMEK